MKLKNISSRKIIASLGDETIEVTINDTFTASVPAGISAGKYEIAKVSPDVAISQIRQIGLICQNRDFTQETLDAEISSHNFGGNVTLAVSAAFFKAEMLKRVQHDNYHFPKLMLLLFEGGLHGNPNIATQEFTIIEENVDQAKKDFAFLESHLSEKLVGAEGGFSPKSFDDQKCLAIIKELFPNRQIAIDVAGSFGRSNLDYSGLFSVEDPFDDESWDKFAALTAENKFLVVGDDLTATNPDRIQKAIDLKAISAVVIKPNQIGTITGAIKAAKLAKKNNLKVIVSHRGDETNDTWIVDFALAVQADFVKFGGMDRGERVAKYNRLLEFQTSQSHF